MPYIVVSRATTVTFNHSINYYNAAKISLNDETMLHSQCYEREKQQSITSEKLQTEKVYQYRGSLSFL